MKNFTFIILNILISLNLTAVYAAPGELDATFGANGTVVTQVGAFTNFANAIAVQPDGKIIAVGEGTSGMGVVRYNTNGTLDSTFNGSGIAPLLPGAAYAVAIQPDGKIIVVGNNANPANVDIQVRRYNPNGTLDTTFDVDGIVVTPIGDGTDVGFAVAIQTDGKIIVSGRSDSNPVFVNSFAMVRYNADGSLDTTFDGDGIVIVSGPGNAITDSLALQADGKIVVAHNFYTGSAYVLTVLRYNSNGSLDASFGLDGRVMTSVGTNVEWTSVALQTDGKIVVACSSYTSNAAGYDFWIARYDANGSADSTFGSNGLVVTPIGAGAAFDIPRSIAIQANGKIVVGGKSPNGSNNDFVAVRYNRNGSLDPKWGNGGIVRTDLGANAENIYSVAVQTNGRIVVAGESDLGSPGTRKFALARYMGDPAENFDYDRDGASDISIFRPSNGNWWILGSSSGSVGVLTWGLAGDEIASADYDGDLTIDVAVWRAGAFGYLYILQSSNNTFRIEQFGQTGDDPSVVGDYDGDGKAEPAVYRNAAVGNQSYFYYRGSSNNPNGDTTYVPFGTNGDLAARGDYNGDGRLDPTVFRPSSGVWYSLNSANNSVTATQWGISTDKLVPADYTGDGKSDFAVFRDGIWYILQSNTGLTQYAYWGLSADKPVPADYDRDGRADVAVFRDGTWHIRQSTDGDHRTVLFGLPTDIPTPTAYLP